MTIESMRNLHPGDRISVKVEGEKPLKMKIDEIEHLTNGCRVLDMAGYRHELLAEDVERCK